MKSIFRNTFFAISLLFSINTINAQTISNHFFGENAWMPDTIGNAAACTEPPCVLNGKLYKEWGNIKSSHANLIRFGGIAADRNMPTNYQYIKMIDSIRGNGMEPMIQVPYHNGRYTAQQAADIVKYINVTKGKKVKYWIIGNEPDLGYSFNSAAQVAAYIKPFSSAMKAIDPTILIVGPECAWYNSKIINGLTTANGPDDITGKDLAGNYYLDIISFHTYPFNGSQTRQDVVSKLTAPGSFQDNLIALSSRVASCNASHGRSGNYALKMAVTEANINWQNNITDNLSGVGANSFVGGQFIAEMMGIAMKNGVDFVNLWSVTEGNSPINNIGYIDPTTNNKKPSYYHFQFLAENFKGNYVNSTSNIPTVKTFGSQDSKQITVLIMNQDLIANYHFTVRLNTAPIVGTDPLKITMNAGIAMEYKDVISNQSSILITFNSAGAVIKKCEYSLAMNAMANMPPTCTEFGVATAVAETSKPSELALNVFPNPTVGKFTVVLNTTSAGMKSADEKDIEIALINTIGQEVFRKKANLVDGREEITLQPDVADGVYFVRMKQEDVITTKKIIVNR